PPGNPHLLSTLLRSQPAKQADVAQVSSQGRAFLRPGRKRLQKRLTDFLRVLRLKNSPVDVSPHLVIEFFHDSLLWWRFGNGTTLDAGGGRTPSPQKACPQLPSTALNFSSTFRNFFRPRS